MPYTLTVRLDDQLYGELTAAAAARDTTLSELARGVLSSAIVSGNDAADRGSGGKLQVPASLPTVQRHQLALLHIIAARLAAADADQEKYHLDAAEVFNRGYAIEYGDVMIEVGAELTAGDAELVMDILDMFTALQSSIGQLTEADRQALGDDRLRRAQFLGFDLNDSHESRLLRYAKHMLAQDRWTNLAEYFDGKHESGNSHMPALPVYRRMLAEFRPIWRRKLREMSGDYILTAEEIRTVADSHIHPDHR